MSNMAIMCRCVEISLLGCVEQNVVQNVPSLTRFLPKGTNEAQKALESETQTRADALYDRGGTKRQVNGKKRINKFQLAMSQQY